MDHDIEGLAKCSESSSFHAGVPNFHDVCVFCGFLRGGALRPKYYFISILLVSPLLYNCSKYLVDLPEKLKGNVAEETSVSQ